MATDDRLLRKSTVYAFHVPNMNVIKVGFGTDGRSRMNNYSRQYGLLASAVSLREWKLPSPSLASSIETACHRALLEAGFGRVSHVVDEREANELFNLGHHAYEQAVLVVAEAIEETISSLYEELGKLKPLSQEKARQQKEEAQRRRYTIREEKKKKKEDDENRLISAAAPEIQRRWCTDVEPFAKACDDAKAVWKQFNNYQGLINSLWNGKQSAAFRMRKWEQWPLVKRLIPVILNSSRQAKAFYYEMNNKYGNCAEQAAKSLGLSLWNPRGHYLPIAEYPDERGMAFLEVQLVVQLAAGFGSDDAIELMNADSEIMALVKLAAQTPAPELKDKIGR